MYLFAARHLLPTRIVIVGGSFLYTLLLVTAGSVMLRAADLSIPTQVGAAGGVVTTNVQYRAEKAAVSALQFDLTYDKSHLTVVGSLGSAAAAAGKTLASNVLPDGSVRMIIFGLNQNVIGDGSVVDLTITLNANSRPGVDSLDFRNALGSSPSGQAVSIGVRSGVVVTSGKPK